MQAPHDTNGVFLRRIAVGGATFFTALVVLFAITVDAGTAVSIMAPFWLMTMLVAVATFAAGTWLGSRTPATAADEPASATA